MIYYTAECANGTHRTGPTIDFNRQKLPKTCKACHEDGQGRRVNMLYTAVKVPKYNDDGQPGHPDWIAQEKFRRIKSSAHDAAHRENHKREIAAAENRRLYQELL